MKLSLFEIVLFRILPNFLLRRILPFFKKFSFFKETKNTMAPIFFDMWYNQKVIGHCRAAHWPVHPTSMVINPKNIYCGIETSPGITPGNYIQAIGKIFVGDYTQIGPNVGIISANHDLTDSRNHIKSEVIIGKYCWIGMGAIILPGVQLGNYTIVAAGSVVTKSFVEGFCVIGGNPAKVIKSINKDECIFHKSKYEYNGYIPAEKFKLINNWHTT